MTINIEDIKELSTSNLKIFQPNKKLYFALAQKDKVDYIYNTSALEGNNMSYPEVETLLDGVTVGGHKLSDEQQILNQNRSVKLLFDLIKNDTFKVTKDIFLKLHNEVAREEAATWGEFRKGGVNIGGTEYKPPFANELDDIFDNGLNVINKIENPIHRGIVFFVFGAKNQFFYDGNKRTSRLMMNGIFLDAGLPLLNMKVKDKLEINKQMLNFYNNDGIKDVVTFFANYYIKQNKNLVQSQGMER